MKIKKYWIGRNGGIVPLTSSHLYALCESGTDLVVRTNDDPQKLSDWAYEHGAVEVKHFYDWRKMYS